MLYSKSQLAVRHAASKDSTRENLCGVRFKKDGTVEATDGHILCRIKAETPPVGEFPTVGDAKLEGEVQDFTLELGAVERIVKALPKRPRMPVLAHAAVNVPATNGNGSAEFITTDLETAQTIKGRKLEDNWPNTDMVIPADDGEGASFCVNLSLLVRIEKSVREFMGGSRIGAPVRIKLGRDGYAPIKITAKNPDVGELTAVVMPMRMDD